MLIEQVVATLVVLLLLAHTAMPLSRLLRMPYTSILVIVGFLASELIVFAGIDTGVRAETFHDLIFFVFIPVLVFESAYKIDEKLLLKNIVPILTLAIIGMLLTAAFTAVGLFYGIGHETGFPWVAALLTGAILAATDPVAVVASLRQVKAPERLQIMLEGESLFNDATAIVLFGVFMSMALAVDAAPTTGQVIGNFLLVFVGGSACGFIIGFVAGYVNRYHPTAVMTGALCLAVAYGSFLVAEKVFHVSGVMSTLVAALVMSYMVKTHLDEEHARDHDYLWDVIGHIANAFVFIVMGVVITVGMFEDRWLAMLIAIVAVLLARAVSTYGSLGLLNLFQKDPVDIRYQTIVVWGGLRGAVTLALALSLPVELEYWWTIQSIAFGVVLFTLFIQAPTVRMLVLKLGIK